MVHSLFARRAREMIDDVKSVPLRREHKVDVFEGDARSVAITREFDAVVTSPPYPNRHDYTRVFHIDLLLLGLTEPEVSALRHRSLRSHVEATTPATPEAGFTPPEALSELLEAWPNEADRRVPRMLAGYFEDLHTTLIRVGAMLRPRGRAAFVVGNVRHAGRLVLVDEILVQVALQAGLRHEDTWVIRERGNSAQQMGRLGRVPSRESIVFLSKP